MRTLPPGRQPVSPQAPTYPASYARPPALSPKKGLRWWGWLLIVGCGVLVGCCGLGIGVSALSNMVGRTTVHGATATGATPTAQGPATAGSTIIANGVACTLLSARVVPGDIYIKPDPGNVFVLVRVKLVNHSASEFGYSPYSFNAESGAGNLRHPDVFYPGSASTSTPLRDGTLAVGGSVEGSILFQIPEDDHQAKLTWQPTIFSDKTSNVWLLGV